MKISFIFWLFVSACAQAGSVDYLEGQPIQLSAISGQVTDMRIVAQFKLVHEKQSVAKITMKAGVDFSPEHKFSWGEYTNKFVNSERNQHVGLKIDVDVNTNALAALCGCDPSEAGVGWIQYVRGKPDKLRLKETLPPAWYPEGKPKQKFSDCPGYKSAKETFELSLHCINPLPDVEPGKALKRKHFPELLRIRWWHGLTYKPGPSEYAMTIESVLSRVEAVTLRPVMTTKKKRPTQRKKQRKK